MPVDLDYIRLRCVEEGECWIWRLGTDKGKPRLSVGGQSTSVRRLAYKITHGDPGRMNVTDKCGERLCCNPEHLRAATHSQIGVAAAKAGAFSSMTRKAKISEARRRHAKLSDEQVCEIRISTDSGPALSAKYGVSKTTVNKIRAGKLRKDYSNPFSQLMR